jgi:hypothetical protein
MKGEFTLQELLEHCERIVNHWKDKAMPSIPIPEDPIKKVIDKGGLMKAEDRKHWKALGLYYAILSNTAEPFLEDHSTLYTREEFTALCDTVKVATKEFAIKSIKTLLQTLKKRKYRTAE